MFYDEWVLQLYLLSGVEIVVILVVLVYEFILECHKSRFIMIIELTYSGCIISMNILLLCKYEYFADDEEITDALEVLLNLLIYLMIMLIGMRLLL